MGIPIVYFRSSSYNTHRMCEQKFYLEYVLGIKEASNKKADKGTIVHKVLEICALCKEAIQNGEKTFDDPDIGEVFTDRYNPEYLGSIISRVYQYYTDKFDHHKWYESDFKDCVNWTWKALKYKNGFLDPMNQDVVKAEPFFDFEIEEDWGKFEYPEHGLKGRLSLKGTVDLIVDLGDGVYEIIDYKTGKRLDWATGKEKDQNKLYMDPQLRLYHKAAKHMYPDIKTFVITIYFINDGGPYTVHFTDDDLELTDKMIRRRFEEIQKTEKPRLIWQRDPKQKWVCRAFCGAGKTTFEGTHVEPMVETRSGQITPKGEVMTKCEQCRYMIQKKGIDWVTENYKEPSFNFASYGTGGGRTHEEPKNE
jgi:hypothetical protein